jgi:hypothetical protein
MTTNILRTHFLLLALLSGLFFASCRDVAPGHIVYDPVVPPNGGKTDKTDLPTCDDGNLCSVDDVVVDGFCTGTPMVCDAPPSRHCLDDTVLRSYQPAGRCASGNCEYESVDLTCDSGCDDVANRCAEDPCAGLSCVKPPESFCANDSELHVYADIGSCDGGACKYGLRKVACTYGCLLGECVDDPCADVTCNTPPATHCGVEPDALISFDAVGTCVGGVCQYTEQTSQCEFGCERGMCAEDPCVGATCNKPPASYCSAVTGNLLSYDSHGTCQTGKCSYPLVEEQCTFGCDAGECLPDPCALLECSTPPQNYCVDANTLYTHAADGGCFAGACTYSGTESECEFGCGNGECLEDPCTNVVCDTPPVPECDGPLSVVSYASTGSCSLGVCTYEETAQNCAGVCNKGICVLNSPGPMTDEDATAELPPEEEEEEPQGPSKTITPPVVASCDAPYHVLSPAGVCFWSCGSGTTPDRNDPSGECLCMSGYVETGTDALGRRVCSPVAKCARC